jgi:DnaJ-class molecular chaperone
MTLKWEGPECQMCHGTGVAQLIPGDGIPRYVHCAACNGHGREPSESPEGES